MIEALVTVGQGQVQEQVQTEIGLGVSSVESTTILQETAQQHKWTEVLNKFNNCLIWTKSNFITDTSNGHRSG